MDSPVRALGLPGDGERGEHDGEVGLDAVAQPVEDGAGGQVGLGHPERALDLVEVVVGGDHRRPVEVWVPGTRSRHATCRYSWRRPPRRSRRSGRTVAPDVGGVGPAGGC